MMAGWWATECVDGPPTPAGPLSWDAPLLGYSPHPTPPLPWDTHSSGSPVLGRPLNPPRPERPQSSGSVGKTRLVFC